MNYSQGERRMDKFTGIKTYEFDGEEYVKKDEAVKDYLASMGQRGMVYVMVLNVLTEEYGKEKAVELLKKAVFRWGEMMGEQLKAQGVVTARDMADKWCLPLEVPAIGYEEVESSTDRVTVRLSTCCHKPVWEATGIPKEEWPLMCEIAEELDLGVAKPLGLKIEFSDLIAKGDKGCELTISKQ
jgi:hypothetical protein